MIAHDRGVKEVQESGARGRCLTPDEGVLFVCGTPIGNLEDITLRALRVLKEVDLIAAEDTRRTLRLLNHYGISKPLTSYHEHNKEKSGEALISKLKKGYKVALVTDAGMPGISDPGQDLIRRAREAGIQIEVVPGPSAVSAALALSGMTFDTFTFVGFLPRKRSERVKVLERLRDEGRPVVAYEAPHRVVGTLRDVMTVYGEDVLVTLARELTKTHEECLVMPVLTLVRILEARDKPRGEITLIIGKGIIGQSATEKPPVTEKG
ncbi:MAG TPA: 16S rRNA (cytidine(1402)-2'-O)-methyltransferase [Clostridia bacterium]|nr:16S rRNA (cytidine(1402)-2'-O)-methyltransferase [Clostridia bacterium]